MTGILAERVFVASLVCLIFYIFHVGRTKALNKRPGWTWVRAGLCVLSFAATMHLWRHLDGAALSGNPEGAEVFQILQYVIGFLGGVVLLVIGLLRVVTDGLRNEQMLTAAVQGMSEGILYFDSNDRLVLVNSKIAEMYPLARDVFVPGVSYETCLRTGVATGQWGPEQGEDKETWIRERLRHHFNPQGPVAFNTPDKRVIRVEEKRTQDGGIVGIRTDITDLWQAEKEVEAQRDQLSALNAQKDRFFAIIAHDLKSPFAGLLGFSKILATKGATLSAADAAKYGAIVHNAAEQAYKLLEDLLDWSRLQLDRLEYEPEAIDLSEAIQTNLDRWGPVASAKHITLETDTALSRRVHADARMVNTILRNLIDNAIKFTPDEGTVRIKVAEADGFGVIEVTDTGVGMSQSAISNLFRLDVKNSTKGTKGEVGTGFGLHLCKELVEKQGGEIHIGSAEGQGSSIRFTLPLSA